MVHRRPRTRWSRLSTRTPISLLIGLLLAGVLTAGVVTGCTAPTEPDGEDTAAPSASRTDLAQQVMDRAVTAILADDVASLGAVLDRADPAFSTTAETILHNVVELQPTSFTITVTNSESSLSPDRARLLGPDVFVAESILAWRTPGQDGVSQATVWLTFTGAGPNLRWAGTLDAPASSGWVPLWWIAPVDIMRGEHVIVVATAEEPPATTTTTKTAAGPDWVAETSAAVARIERLAPVRDAVLFEVPANLSQFGRAIGRTDASVGRLAATTIPAGPDPVTAATQIVLSPAMARLAPSERGVVLTHEAAHAVFDDPAIELPLWLEEGTADAIAYDAFPALAVAARTDLVDYLADHPVTALPEDAEFAPTSDNVTQTYELAWTACSYIAEAHGWPALLRIRAELSHDPRTDWWRLIGEPSEAAFVDEWLAWANRPL